MRQLIRDLTDTLMPGSLTYKVDDLQERLDEYKPNQTTASSRYGRNLITAGTSIADILSAVATPVLIVSGTYDKSWEQLGAGVGLAVARYGFNKLADYRIKKKQEKNEQKSTS